jgi:DNA repair photolyase
MFRPIYEPRTRAREYSDLAINIYKGCNHGCTYCYARKIAERYTSKDCICSFDKPKVRGGIVEAVKNQMSGGKYRDKKILLCFTCDPYPAEIDTTPTREVIEAIKNAGGHVSILTKGGLKAERDFDLLDENDSFGVTYSGCKDGELFNQSEYEPNATPPYERLAIIHKAHKQGIKTWMSCEPVIVENDIYTIIQLADYVDFFKIGKLNYYPSDINWGEFGRNCERLCKKYNRNYYIKEDLRALM